MRNSVDTPLVPQSRKPPLFSAECRAYSTCLAYGMPVVGAFLALPLLGVISAMGEGVSPTFVFKYAGVLSSLVSMDRLLKSFRHLLRSEKLLRNGVILFNMALATGFSVFSSLYFLDNFINSSGMMLFSLISISSAVAGLSTKFLAKLISYCWNKNDETCINPTSPEKYTVMDDSLNVEKTQSVLKFLKDRKPLKSLINPCSFFLGGPCHDKRLMVNDLLNRVRKGKFDRVVTVSRPISGQVNTEYLLRGDVENGGSDEDKKEQTRGEILSGLKLGRTLVLKGDVAKYRIVEPMNNGGYKVAINFPKFSCFWIFTCLSRACWGTNIIGEAHASDGKTAFENAVTGRINSMSYSS